MEAIKFTKAPWPVRISLEATKTTAGNIPLRADERMNIKAVGSGPTLGAKFPTSFVTRFYLSLITCRIKQFLVVDLSITVVFRHKVGHIKQVFW